MPHQRKNVLYSTRLTASVFRGLMLHDETDRDVFELEIKPDQDGHGAIVDEAKRMYELPNARLVSGGQSYTEKEWQLSS